MQAVNQDEVEHNLLLQSYRLMHRTAVISDPLQALLGAKRLGALVLLILVGRRTHAGTRRQIADKLNLSRESLHNSSRVCVDRIGMGCKADFAANSTAIGKKFNAADRPSPGYHGPRGVMQRVPKCQALPIYCSSASHYLFLKP